MFLRSIFQFLANRPRLENAILQLDKNWSRIPSLSLETIFDDFESQEVRFRELPTGPWASSMIDTVVLAKIALCLRPKRVLEVGSYRGYTAKILAAHTPAGSRIVALDRDPRHGETYRNSTLAKKIERRIADVAQETFLNDPPGGYDLIYLDADHSYDSAKHDTEVLFPLLSFNGLFVWHDYANWGRISRRNGVPKLLHELSGSISIAAIGGTWLAIHSPRWNSEQEGNQQFREAIEKTKRNNWEGIWNTSGLRG